MIYIFIKNKINLTLALKSPSKKIVRWFSSSNPKKNFYKKIKNFLRLEKDTKTPSNNKLSPTPEIIKVPKWKQQPIIEWPLHNRKGGRKNKPIAVSKLVKQNYKGGLFNYTRTTPFAPVHFSFPRDTAVFIVTKVMKQFVEHLFFENWRDYFRSSPHEIKKENLMHYFKNASKINWWSRTKISRLFLVIVKPTPEIIHTTESFIKGLLYFFINNISDYWFFTVHARRLLTYRRRTEALNLYTNPLKNVKNYKTQHFEYLFNFLRRFKLNPFNRAILLYFRSFRLIYLLYTFYHSQKKFSYFTLENLLKSFLTALITQEYIKDKYYLFYPNREEFALFLNKPEFLTSVSEYIRINELHEFVLNYLFLKIFNTLYNPECNLFLSSADNKKLESITNFLESKAYRKNKFENSSWGKFIEVFLDSKNTFMSYYNTTMSESWETTLPRFMLFSKKIPIEDKYISQFTEIQTNRFYLAPHSGLTYAANGHLTYDSEKYYITYLRGRIKIKSIKPEFLVDKESWIEYKSKMENQFFCENITPIFDSDQNNPIILKNKLQINNIIAFSRLVNVSDAYTKYTKIQGFSTWLPKVSKSHKPIKLKFSPVRGWFHKMEWY